MRTRKLCRLRIPFIFTDNLWKNITVENFPGATPYRGEIIVNFLLNSI